MNPWQWLTGTILTIIAGFLIGLAVQTSSVWTGMIGGGTMYVAGVIIGHNAGRSR